MKPIGFVHLRELSMTKNFIPLEEGKVNLARNKSQLYSTHAFHLTTDLVCQL